jgi:predicted transcriptional regulator
MKHGQYRNREEITASILKSANSSDGMSKTRIMFHCFLSYAQLTDYLHHLTNSELLEYDNVGKLYKTTSKGLEFMGLYSKMEEIVHVEQFITHKNN